MSSQALSSILLLLLSSFAAPLNAQIFECDAADKKTLLKIKAEFGNPVALSSWNPTTNCCTWKGNQCESAGKTLDLNLTSFNFIGPIPPSIAELPSLSYLTLSNIPGLTGPIPSSLANLTYLHSLTITKTTLSGTIPTYIVGMRQLSSLDLSNNKLSGPIPNIFRSTIMQVSTIDLSHNQLTGSIPASLYAGSITNPQIFLSYNLLTGTIPQVLGKVDFDTFDVSHNQLTGDASFLFGATKRATEINLSWNGLSFDISRLGFSDYQVGLDLSHNVIRGSIPRSIARLKNLKKFDVSNNRLCGRIPAGGKMGMFGSASFVQNKCLCGAPLQKCGGKET